MEILGPAAIGAAATVVLQRLGMEVGKFTDRYHERKRREESRLEDELDLRHMAMVKDDIARERLGRAAAHLYWQEGNIEDITYRAVGLIPFDAPSSPAADIDESWFSVFRDNAKHSSEEEAQRMWAQILAGEATEPGSYSKRTLNTLGGLGQPEVKAFNTLGAFTPDNFDRPLVFDFSHRMYVSAGLTQRVFNDLRDADLIDFDGLQEFSITIEPSTDGSPHWIKLGEYQVTFSADPAGTPSVTPVKLPVGYVRYTAIGRELLQLATERPSLGFVQHTAEFWESRGITTTIRKH